MNRPEISELATPLRRFKPYPAYKDSGVEWLGQIPAGWRLQPLWTMYRRVKRTGHAEQELLSVYRDYGVIPTASRDDNFNRPSEDLSTYQLVEKRDLVTNKMKTWQGSIAVSEHVGIVSPAYHVYRPMHDEGDRYLHHLFRSSPYVSGYMQMSKGIRVSQWDLEPEAFSRVLVLLPSSSEQRVIAAFLDRETARIDELIAKKKQLVDLLEEEHKVLIHRSVTKGLNQNVPMKNSGIGGVGEIPAHWEVKRLWHLTPSNRRIMYGIVLPGPNVEGGVPIVKGGDVSPERLRLESLSRTAHEIEAGYVRSRLRGGDLVYSIRGSIGEVAMVPPELEGANLTQDAARIAYTPATIGSWLAYALKSSAVFSQLEAGALGATIRGINIRDLKRTCIPVPPMHEQELIADFLDRQMNRIDELVAKVREAVGSLREFRTALISAAVTGKIDVRGEIE